MLKNFLLVKLRFNALLIFFVFLIVIGYMYYNILVIQGKQKQIDVLEKVIYDQSIEQGSASVQNQDGLKLKQERVLVYRRECQTEWSDKEKTVDSLVKSFSNITKEQAQNIAKRAGIVDENGYVIDLDIWIKKCIEQKLSIEENL